MVEGEFVVGVCVGVVVDCVGAFGVEGDGEPRARSTERVIQMYRLFLHRQFLGDHSVQWLRLTQHLTLSLLSPPPYFQTKHKYAPHTKFNDQTLDVSLPTPHNCRRSLRFLHLALGILPSQARSPRSPWTASSVGAW